MRSPQPLKFLLYLSSIQDNLNTYMITLSKATKVIEKSNTRGTFEIEGLYPGYGVTIGNRLRRVLLYYLEGAAVTQVKIKGISHEFATIAGVSEDVLSILLNLKQLRFILVDSEAQTATLKVKGDKKVTGSDFKLPAQVELANKDLHVATLTDKKAELELEIVIEKGIGYVSAEARQRGKQEIGTLSLDAIFTPVQRVNYKVENMRVGERTDFDRLIIEIETDGTIDPEAALLKASDILVEQFKIVGEGLEEETAVKKAPAKKATAKKAAAKKTTTKKK